MIGSRDIRRCALQVLYQLDTGSLHGEESIRQSLADSPGDEQAHESGYQLACSAWEVKKESDEAVAVLSPEWPIHRQPVVDRNILRLAYYEMTTGDTPPKVAINEAVELAKEFSTEKSPMFINGILDKIYKSMHVSSEEEA